MDTEVGLGTCNVAYLSSPVVILLSLRCINKKLKMVAAVKGVYFFYLPFSFILSNL